MKSVSLKMVFFLIVVALFASPAIASQIGSSSAFPGYSAKDIISHDPGSISGIYWIDPDGKGGDSPFQAYGDMTTSRGGWTLARPGQGNTNPSMDGHSVAIRILAQDQYALIRFEGSGINAFYNGHYGEQTPSASGWTVLSGDASPLYNNTWDQAMGKNYNVWIRETTTPVPSPVPIPAAVWLLGSGLLGLVGIRRRNTGN